MSDDCKTDEASNRAAGSADESQQTELPFGNRYLTNPENVFKHNAWDNVSWDEDQLAEAQKKVDANSSDKVQQEMQEKYEDDADQFWNDFYSQHQNRFFKDRHWLFKEFPELATSANAKPTSVGDEVDGEVNSVVESTNVQHGDLSDENSAKEHDDAADSTKCVSVITGTQEGQGSNGDASPSHSRLSMARSSQGDQCTVDGDSQTAKQTGCSDADGVGLKCRAAGEGCRTDGDGDHQFVGQWGNTRILEVGCGVGNTVFPILQTNNDPGLFVYCCDFSDVAINLVQDHADYNPRRCHAFVCDITDEDVSLPFPENSLDVVILIFVLSAVNPDKMQSSINRLSRCLKPGGLIVLRDYGRYDLAQLRFKKGRCLSEHFYVRGDGTRVYFFTQEELKDLFTNAGLKEEQNTVDKRLQVNRGRQLTMYRVWIQCKYRKPATVS